MFVLKLNLTYDIPPGSYPGGFNLLRCQRGPVGHLHAQELSTLGVGGEREAMGCEGRHTQLLRQETGTAHTWF